MSVQDFYAPRRWTRKFWEYGDAYTIVLNRHIGLDIGGWGGKTATVPALLAGRVTQVVYTVSMGMCVEVQAGGRYYTYCHLADDRLPREGAWLNQGDRVGRLAVGPKTPRNHPDYPGSSWSGVHLHLVVSNKSRAAYSYPRVAGSEFYDPAPIIRSVLASTAGGGGATPIEKEEDMPLDANADYPAFLNMLQRAFRFDLRPNGAGPDWKFGPTVWERLDQVASAAQQTMTPEQVKSVADAVTKAIGQPKVNLDYAAIAKAVNDDAAKRMSQ